MISDPPIHLLIIYNMPIFAFRKELGNFTKKVRLRKLTEIKQKQDPEFLITKGKMKNKTNYFVFIITFQNC